MAGPRLSIIPGRFAGDPRADLAHFRVLNQIGTHTDKNGWCQVKQGTIAECIGLARETVNRKIHELVKWGYVERQKNDRTGRSIWYRVILDQPGGPPQHDDTPEVDANDDASRPENTASDAAMQDCNACDGPVSGGSHVGYNPTHSDHSSCDPTSHSCCDRTQSHRTTSSTSLSNDSPPLPPARGGRGSGKPRNETEGLIEAALDACGSDAVRRFAIEAVLAPVLRRRRFDVPSPEGALKALTDWLVPKLVTPDEALAIVGALCSKRRATVKDSDITDAVKAQIGLRAEPRVHDGDVALMQRWPEVLEGIICQIGPERAAAWFSTVAIDAIDARGVARLVTHKAFIAAHIEQQFTAQARAAIAAVFENVTAVEIAFRRQPIPTIRDAPFPSTTGAASP